MFQSLPKCVPREKETVGDFQDTSMSEKQREREPRLLNGERQDFRDHLPHALLTGCLSLISSDTVSADHAQLVLRKVKTAPSPLSMLKSRVNAQTWTADPSYQRTTQVGTRLQRFLGCFPLHVPDPDSAVKSVGGESGEWINPMRPQDSQS